MLEDHADAELARDLGAGDVDLAPFPQQRAGVGALDAVNELHQRALARAVLAEQRVDLARHDAQIDVVVRQDAGIALGDADQLEPGSFRHRVGLRAGRFGTVRLVAHADILDGSEYRFRSRRCIKFRQKPVIGNAGDRVAQCQPDRNGQQ